ncbi:MAG TPA: alpha/beta hydrolase [Pirellulales bacterium]|nr:alpha/beta hydrolase [Pirellulales bacterium]
MPKYWMITDRNVAGDEFGGRVAGLSYWTADSDDVDIFANWTRARPDAFQKQLVAATAGFPLITDPNRYDDQQHVTLFVHGYNNGWQDAARTYRKICNSLFAGDSSLGLCVLFTWPSAGSPADYLPDRSEAREAAPDLADVLSELYDWLQKKQADAVKSPDKACRAKTSLIAHSMGNYVLEKAMQSAWTRKNRPLLVSLLSQLLMVAADVDNDLFKSGETVDGSDGDAIANLTYRVSVLYSGRDAVLGASAGLKHFGKRRLGRSGLDPNVTAPDNVCEFDCTALLPESATEVHSAYFDEPKTIDLMRGILRGTDRKLLAAQFHVDHG